MEISMWRQSASFLGAMWILIAYAGHPTGWMNPHRAGYNILNAIGSPNPWGHCLPSLSGRVRRD